MEIPYNDVLGSVAPWLLAFLNTMPDSASINWPPSTASFPFYDYAIDSSGYWWGPEMDLSFMVSD